MTSFIPQSIGKQEEIPVQFYIWKGALPLPHLWNELTIALWCSAKVLLQNFPGSVLFLVGLCSPTLG